MAHRLVWLWHYGSWPNGELDHINGNKADNRLENLRDVSHGENLSNQRRAQTSSKNGFARSNGKQWPRKKVCGEDTNKP